MSDQAFLNSFVENLLHGAPPVTFCLGGEPIAPHFGPADAQLRRTAALQGVRCTVSLQLLPGAVILAPTVENCGDADSALLSDIHFCALTLPDADPAALGWGKRRVLYSRGSAPAANDFEPLEQDLALGGFSLAAPEARSSSHHLPYFCCSSLDAQGVIAAIGWSGRWRADFAPIQTGLQLRFTYPGAFCLHPGEKLELPQTLLMPWQRQPDGDSELWDVFNQFRRVMLHHVLPVQTGKVCLRAWGSTDEAGHELRFDNMRRYGLHCDAYGVDAGWHTLTEAGKGAAWHETVGDWLPSPAAWPHGPAWLAQNTRAAGAAGSWLWVELERAVEESGAFRTHPEHYLSKPGDGQAWLKYINFGSAAACDFLRGLLYPIIRSMELDIFRIDFNLDPGPVFDHCDGPGRQGVTELQYYNGLYAFFARLLADFPGMVIDNCAGGGKRLDWRMCSYGVPIMCRSDYFTLRNFAPEAVQAQTLALARWLPVNGDSYGTCMGDTTLVLDTYRARSSYGASFGLTAPWWPLTDEQGRWYRQILDEAAAVKDAMPLDFYPLTGYSLSPRVWCAWQTCADDGSRAMVAAFRRALSAESTRTFALQGLAPDAVYTATDVDGNALGSYTGKQLAVGFCLTLPQPRSSTFVFFTR